jgi:hypothetical protein
MDVLVCLIYVAIFVCSQFNMFEIYSYRNLLTKNSMS